MSSFKILGKQKVKGEIKVAGNKNAALPIIAASFMIEGKIHLSNVPDISDVRQQIDILKYLGGVIKFDNKGHEILIDTSSIHKLELTESQVSKTRGSLLFIGSILAKYKKITMFPSGGDKLGKRPVEPYFTSLKQLGCDITFDGTYIIDSSKAKSGRVWQEETGVVGTEIIIMLSTLLAGNTIIINAASEPHVQNLCEFLNFCGAKISGIGSNVLNIEGVKTLVFPKDKFFEISKDYMETGTFISLASITGSEIKIIDADIKNLYKILFELSKLGVKYIIENNNIIITEQKNLKIKDMIDGSLNKLESMPWPGFPTDVLQVATVVATQSKGHVLIHEKLYEGRFAYVSQLNSMGARIIECDPHRILVSGGTPLYGSKSLKCPDIRAGMALLIATFAAEGESILSDIETIERGYENLESRLTNIGFNFQRI